MARQWPVDSIPDSNVVPDGVYLLTVASIEETQSGKGKLMYKGEFRIAEPKQFAGSPLYENFVIGSDDDPDAEDPETWKAAIGSRILKKVFHACGVEQSSDIDDMIGAAEAQAVVGIISRTVDDGKRDPQYKGQERNRITAFYPPGEREVKVDGVPARRAAASAPVARRAAPAPVIEEDDEPAPPPAAKRGRPAGAVPKAQTAPIAAPAAATAKEVTITCDVCKEKIVGVKAFTAHVAQHEQDEE